MRALSLSAQDTFLKPRPCSCNRCYSRVPWQNDTTPGPRELAPAWRGRRHAFSLPSVAALPAEGEGNASETDVAGVVVTARPIGAAVAVAATGAGGGCGRFDLLAVRRERVPAGAEVVQALSCGLAGVLRSTSTTSGASRPTAARARAFAAIAMPFGPAPMTVRQCHRSLNIATMPELFCGSVSSTSALISSFCACDTSASAPAPIPAPTAALASRAGGRSVRRRRLHPRPKQRPWRSRGSRRQLGSSRRRGG